jgi:AhpD family alkylhydroperoxidase
VSSAAAPRLTPRAADDWAADERDLLRGRLTAADRYLTGEPDAPPLPGILGLLGHHPRLAANWLAFSGELLDEPVLDPRDRELLILRVGWRTQCRYEWAQHVRMARDAGVTAAEIDAVVGPLDAGWSGRDRDLLAAADQMIDQHRIDDATWRRLATRFDEAELLELLFIVGSYLCLALVLNSVGLEPDPGSDDSSELPAPRRSGELSAPRLEGPQR